MIFSPGDWNLCQAGHGNGLIRKIFHIFQIYQIGTVRAQKAPIRLQLLTQLVQAANAFQNPAAGQMNEQRTMNYLAIF